jgi:hypothetical protein
LPVTFAFIIEIFPVVPVSFFKSLHIRNLFIIRVLFVINSLTLKIFLPLHMVLMLFFLLCFHQSHLQIFVLIKSHCGLKYGVFKNVFLHLLSRDYIRLIILDNFLSIRLHVINGSRFKSYLLFARYNTYVFIVLLQHLLLISFFRLDFLHFDLRRFVFLSFFFEFLL